MDKREAERKSDSICGYAHRLEVKEKIFEDYPEVDFVYDSSKDIISEREQLKQLLDKYQETSIFQPASI